ncbi:hypothetical protein ACFSRY_04260 [Pontibacter locisalis]|uniref:Uncharacterized protein n=1 Tax=Pontibacter locisalis TaxID=1719035 RepID=A0ABW5IIY3_9BACT
MNRINYVYLISVIVAAPILYFAWTRLPISPAIFLITLAALQPALYYTLKLILTKLQR